MLQNSRQNNCDRVTLNHFNQMFHFNTPQNVRKPLTILGGIETEQLAKMGCFWVKHFSKFT